MPLKLSYLVRIVCLFFLIGTVSDAGCECGTG